MSTQTGTVPPAGVAAETRIVRWGVIGSGGIARRRTIPEGFGPAANARLVAVYDPSRELNAAVARESGALAADSLEALLASPIDAVYIASPADLHREQALACARAGRHVLSEKPLALTAGDAQGVVAACAAAGVKLGVGLMMRFHAQHRAARELIAAGKIGRPVFARAQLSCWYPPIPGAWRQDPARGGGGALMDLGGHCIDLLEMFFGPVSAVTCVARRIVHAYPVEDGAVVTLQFANGALGVVDTFFCVPDEGSRNVLELYGTDGSILASGTIGQGDRGRMTAHFRPGSGAYEARQQRSDDEGMAIDPPPVNMYRAEIEEFSQAILDRREPANHGGLGLRSQQVLAACYESARTGGAVRLD